MIASKPFVFDFVVHVKKARIIKIERGAASLKQENQTTQIQMNQLLDQQHQAELQREALNEQLSSVQQERDELKVRIPVQGDRESTVHVIY